MAKQTPEERFWGKVIKTNSCWLWRGGIVSSRNPAFRFYKKTISVHRFAYKLTNGDIPKDMYIIHCPRNITCIRPEHLFLGTGLHKGEATSRGRKKEPLGERFWSKVDKNGPIPSHRPELGPCWIWIARRDRYG